MSAIPKKDLIPLDRLEAHITISELEALEKKVAALEAEKAELRKLAEEMLGYVVLVGGGSAAKLAMNAAKILAKHDAVKGRDDEKGTTDKVTT